MDRRIAAAAVFCIALSCLAACPAGAELREPEIPADRAEIGKRAFSEDPIVALERGQ